ncbi:hypothetical protein Vi05172_g9810 [Venturia inaequalis]|nr:hypothetical protein Vi05172_g9810 [Venturia inaequalis]
MSKKKLLVLRKTLNKLLAKEFIRLSSSEGSSLVLFI